MQQLRHSESIEIDATPEQVWDLVTDISRTGEWSPICRESWWKTGDGPEVGNVLVGRNVHGEREWETESTVIEAERPTAYAWAVGPNLVRWGYRIEATDTGARLTESWAVQPAGEAFFRERFGDQADAELEDRRRAAVSGIPATLAAIKKIAESESE